MAKISELPSATTLDGTETIPAMDGTTPVSLELNRMTEHKDSFTMLMNDTSYSVTQDAIFDDFDNMENSSPNANLSTGIFTVANAGVYYFTFQAQFETSAHIGDVRMVMRRSSIETNVSIHSVKNLTDENWGDMYALASILDLQVGDEVYVKGQYQSAGVVTLTRAAFSGVQL